MKTYTINEIFYSLQGEGVRAGTPNVFIRFSGCNLACDLKEGPRSPGGFACDTEFVSGRALTLEEIHKWVTRESEDCRWLILTGGEPTLQVDKEFCDYFHKLGYFIAIETNGSIKLPVVLASQKEIDTIKNLERAGVQLVGGPEDGLRYPFDWITVSPKVAEHAIRQLHASEVKYVRGYGQGIPKTVVEAENYLISPAFSGNQLDKETLEWCIKLVKENPKWRLSVQQHKNWQVR